MMKKIACLLMATLMVASLTACGENAPAESSAAAESSVVAETDADAAATFKIGGMGPLTGGAAVYGQAVKNAAELAVAEVNANGGVNGVMFELNFQDDEHDVEKAVNAYNVVKDWGAQMILGAVTSAPCTAVAAKTYEDNMFQITPSGTAVECVQYDNAFRLCFSDPDQGAASAKFIGDNKLAEKVAIIYDSSTSYSSGIYESFVEGAADYDFEIVAEEAFTEDNNTDFSVQLQKAKDAGADLVFLPIYCKEAAPLLTQAAAMDFAPKFFSCDGMDGILTMEGFDVALAEGVMLLTPFAADATDDKTVAFVTEYQAKYGDVPNQFAADAYDTVYALKAALEKAGATPDMDASAICDALKAAMLEISVDGLTGNGITWTADGEPNKEPKAVIIENGAYKAM